MSRVINEIPDNTFVVVNRQVFGPAETGPYGTTRLWDRVVGFQGNDPAGWVSDAWVYTGSNDFVVNDSACSSAPGS